MIGSRVSRITAAAVFSLAIPALLLSGCSGGNSSRVVEIAKTWSYHRPECRRVFMARTQELTREEARALALKPCPLCRPDSQ